MALKPCYTCDNFNKYTGDQCYSPKGDLLAGKDQLPSKCKFYMEEKKK